FIVLGEPESDMVDRVRALDRGCDDFLAKPFDYQELLARIRAVLRRTTPAAHETLRAGPITADLATRCVAVDGVPVTLASKEYELLLKLMTDPTRVFTKEQLLREVWDFRSLGRTRTLDSHASRLRRKLGTAAPGNFVLNVWGGWGTGYSTDKLVLRERVRRSLLSRPPAHLERRPRPRRPRREDHTRRDRARSRQPRPGTPARQRAARDVPQWLAPVSRRRGPPRTPPGRPVADSRQRSARSPRRARGCGGHRRVRADA